MLVTVGVDVRVAVGVRVGEGVLVAVGREGRVWGIGLTDTARPTSRIEVGANNGN